MDLASLSKFTDTRQTAGCNHSAQLSEALSFEMLREAAVLGAALRHTEMNVCYVAQHSCKIDYTCVVRDESGSTRHVGVSVTRAYRFKQTTGMDQKSVLRLLGKKLMSMARARANVAPNNAWNASLLHIWTATRSTARRIQRCFEAMYSEAHCLPQKQGEEMEVEMMARVQEKRHTNGVSRSACSPSSLHCLPVVDTVLDAIVYLKQMGPLVLLITETVSDVPLEYSYLFSGEEFSRIGLR